MKSPYADQRASPTRGLSEKEISDLAEGKGMGLARAAELNDYPGPRHVLDMREQLGLTQDAAAQIEQIYARMNANARALGGQILAGEKELSHAFASAAIDREQVEQRTEELAALYGRLRAVHLIAHLETKQLLSPGQVARYAELRGYGTPDTSSGHHGG